MSLVCPRVVSGCRAPGACPEPAGDGPTHLSAIANISHLISAATLGGEQGECSTLPPPLFFLQKRKLRQEPSPARFSQESRKQNSSVSSKHICIFPFLYHLLDLGSHMLWNLERFSAAAFLG